MMNDKPGLSPDHLSPDDLTLLRWMAARLREPGLEPAGAGVGMAVVSAPSILGGKCSSDISALASALAKAQGTMKGAIKDSYNLFFKSHYADLASNWDACRVALSENGLSVIQLLHSDPAAVSHLLLSDPILPEAQKSPDPKNQKSPDPKNQKSPEPTRPGIITLFTILLHSSGQWIGSEWSIPIANALNAHAIASLTTYMRRIALASLIGLAPEDDDGNTAAGKYLLLGKPGEVMPIKERNQYIMEAVTERMTDLPVDPEIVSRLTGCLSLSSLQFEFSRLSPEQRRIHAGVKDAMKLKIGDLSARQTGLPGEQTGDSEK